MKNPNISAKEFLCPLYSHLNKSKLFKIILVAQQELVDSRREDAAAQEAVFATQ